jgi:hypothetical protein
MFHFVRTCHTRLAIFPLIVLSAFVLPGCGSSSNPAPSPPPPPPPSVSIATTSLPSGQVGAAYSATLAATGGTAPYTWSLVSGLPPALGLSLNAASGVLAGDPAVIVTAVSVTFMVTDSSKPALTRSASLPLTIAPAILKISTRSLPNGQAGLAYSANLTAKGGTPPFNWTLTGGTLPTSLSLNAASGAISGTPTAPVVADSLTLQVTDAGNPMQSYGTTLALTITPPPVNITTTSLAYGQVGVAYSATLSAAGGTPPYTWTLTNGALAAGLSLSTSGSITGTPSATATQTPLSFQVVDSGNPAQQKVVVLNLTVGAGGITVSIPAQASTVAAGLTITQAVSVSATTNDNAGVTWTLAPVGGSPLTPTPVSPATSLSGANVTLTAPSTAGVYTLTATSATDNTVSASATVGVTDLAGVYTWHNDLARDGVNAQEYALTTANVNTASFGKLFSCPVDGAVYAQPLWVANATVGGARHNVVLVATQHDSLFAVDADASPCQQLWQASLIDSNHGGTSGEIPVPSVANCQPKCYVGQGDGNIQPEVGVTSTPVMDPTSGTLYVVSKSMNAAGTSFYQRLHAIDYTTGNEKPGSPVTIAATANYPGPNSTTVTVTFNPQTQNQRAGLALVNGTVYIAWASHEDTPPYYGWVIGYTYNGSAFTQSGVYCATPNAGNGGIWMSGAAPAADNNGHLYVITGNGQFDVDTAPGVPNTIPPNNDYGDSFLQLSNGASGLSVSSYFTPSDQENDFENDKDAGSGGTAVVLNLSGSPAHLVIGGGKDGTLYVLNGDAMGGSGDANAWESFSVAPLFSTGAFWNNSYYIAPAGYRLQAFAFSTATDELAATPASESAVAFGWPGATPSISATGSTANGIVWALNTNSYCTPSSCGPALLYAYDAGNLANLLWNSSLVSSDAAGNAVKFMLPTVANGKVYVGTRGNNTGGAYGSTSVNGELDVYGLITK